MHWIFESGPLLLPDSLLENQPTERRNHSPAYLHVVAAESESVAPCEQGALLAAAAIAAVAGRRRFLAAL